MGSYDGVETCELVGCYLLSQLRQIPGIEIGLYGDDRLAILNQTPREMEKAKTQTCQKFANDDLKITVEENKKVVNFLDVKLGLSAGKFKPYSKPSSTPGFTLTANRTTHPTSLET